MGEVNSWNGGEGTQPTFRILFTGFVLFFSWPVINTRKKETGIGGTQKAQGMYLTKYSAISHGRSTAGWCQNVIDLKPETPRDLEEEVSGLMDVRMVLGSHGSRTDADEFRGTQNSYRISDLRMYCVTISTRTQGHPCIGSPQGKQSLLSRRKPVTPTPEYGQCKKVLHKSDGGGGHE